ncbi:hypothetical protein RUM44_005592 [Polyplax serrata]|uniref:Uncharacterized protein n=1 Tax=Polyplax serrata TaxID=468196 RepID=A0ABR1AE92_POLSC
MKLKESTKLKTKLEKHINDNEKRRKALKEKVKVKCNQAEIIKQALSTVSLHKTQTKKIWFSQVDCAGDSSIQIKQNQGNAFHTNGANEKKQLFDGSSSGEEEEFNVEEKAQFKGKKGFELLKLQGSYGNDERFKIDKRFLDENEDETMKQNENLCDETEQLEDLTALLGQSNKLPKLKKRKYEMIRYDVSNKEHEKYEVKQEKFLNERGGKNKKEKKIEKVKTSKVEVSKEKYYDVSKDIKESFGDKKENSNTDFSLLRMYSKSNEESKDNEISHNDNSEVSRKKTKQSKNVKNTFTCKESVDEVHEDENELDKDQDYTDLASEKQTSCAVKYNNANEGSEVCSSLPIEEETQRKVVVAKGIWKETFFFADDDPRLQEGMDFMNKKNSKEAKCAAQNYDTKRKRLREILRLHNKKQLMKKNPFRAKVGGMNKKQLASSKLKTRSTIFQRNKQHSVS